MEAIKCTEQRKAMFHHDLELGESGCDRSLQGCLEGPCMTQLRDVRDNLLQAGFESFVVSSLGLRGWAGRK